MNFKGYILESKTPNNLVLLYIGTYLKIEKMYSLTKEINDSDQIIIFGIIQNYKSIFKLPCNSEDVGLVEISSSENEFRCTLTNVHRKCFHLTLENDK